MGSNKLYNQNPSNVLQSKLIAILRRHNGSPLFRVGRLLVGVHVGAGVALSRAKLALVQHDSGVIRFVFLEKKNRAI